MPRGLWNPAAVTVSGFICAFIISVTDINYQSGVVHYRAQQHDVARQIFNLLLFDGNPSVAAATDRRLANLAGAKSISATHLV